MSKANAVLRKAMCDRLKRLLRIAFDDNWAQFAERMGYAGNSGVDGLKTGKSFPAIQRLEPISEWELDMEGGFTPSLHWIITGKGPAVIRMEGNQIIEGLPLDEVSKRRAYTRRI